MMFRLLLLLSIAILPAQISSQSKTCEKNVEEQLLDLNSITKCSVESKKNTENSNTEAVVVNVVSRKRVLRKRDKATGVVTNNHTHKLASMKKKISKMNDLSFDKTGGLKIVPFNFVDEIPLFKSCENSPIYLQERCFKKELSKHIRKNLMYPEDAYDRGIQGRVFVHFVINNKGNVDQMKIVSPYKGEALGKEAKRILKKLPQFKPGKHSGTAVTVKYGLPITFKIPGVRRSNIKKNVEKKDLKEIYSFNQIEKLPQFKSCNNSGDKSIKCFNKELINHIQENFAYPTSAINDNIQGTVNVKFIIDAKGEVINIKTKGPDNGKILESAAFNLIKKLPKFKPAIKGGKKVNVAYSFPISFSLN